MAAVAFDLLEYACAPESQRVPRDQAEVHAKAMTQVFVHNMDALVTKDYLDTRFTDFETRMEAKMERRFGEVELRFAEIEAKMDRRFGEMDSKMDRRFGEVESKMDLRFADVDVRFARINVMLGVILVAVAIPLLQTFVSWFG